MTENTKYEFTGATKPWCGITLKQIRLLVDIASLGLAAGTVGGWIESEENLQVYGDAWVFGNAEVSGNARVYGDAWVYGNARVSGNARVYGNARVSGDAWVFGNAEVSGNARVSGDAEVSGNAWVYGNARVYGDAWVKTVNVTATRTDGYTFLVAPTPEGPRIIAGCRYFTFEEARKHWNKTRGGTKLGNESIAIVEHLETMAKINGFMEKLT